MVEMKFIVHLWFEFFQKYAERQTWVFAPVQITALGEVY